MPYSIMVIQSALTRKLIVRISLGLQILLVSINHKWEIVCEGSLPLNFSTNSRLTFFNIIHLALLKNLNIILYKKMRGADFVRFLVNHSFLVIVLMLVKNGVKLAPFFIDFSGTKF